MEKIISCKFNIGIAFFCPPFVSICIIEKRQTHGRFPYIYRYLTSSRSPVSSDK